MLSESINMPTTSYQELVSTLESSGFDVAPMGEPWVTDKVSWNCFLIHRAGGVATVSMAIALDGSDAPFLTVSTCRKLLWLWERAIDRRLVADVIRLLIDKGGSKPGISLNNN